MKSSSDFAAPSPEKGGKKQVLIRILVLGVLIPGTLLLAWKYGDRRYYLTSVLLMLYSMIPFFSAFERRRPPARELVVLAVLCAIAVVSRAAFFALPHFKPMTAVVMIAGIAFGAEAGFLTGAMSALVSNFIFGQGVWTPWQMFAFGMAGFLAGLLAKKGWLKTAPLPLSIFGGVMVMLVVGPLLDTCALFTMTAVLSLPGAGAVYLAGLPVNAVHALATVLTLFFFSRPMFEKLDRIKLKYGMLD